MKKLELVSTKTLISFEEFIARNRFQFPDGVYYSHHNDLLYQFHLSFINPVFEDILFSDEISGRIKLPENFSIEKYKLIKSASCIEMQSELGHKRVFTMQTFLATIWSLLYELGGMPSNFIYEDDLYLFHIRYPDDTFETASMMYSKTGVHCEYTINIHPPKLAPLYGKDVWNAFSQKTYILVPAKS